VKRDNIGKTEKENRTYAESVIAEPIENTCGVKPENEVDGFARRSVMRIIIKMRETSDFTNQDGTA